MSLWDERAARNEALFREINEHRKTLSDADTLADETDFVCECSNDDCVERVRVSLAVYERVRSEPSRFLLLPGHQKKTERVIEQEDGFVIVEKEGTAGRIARQTDPRS